MQRLLAGVVCPSLAEKSAAVMWFMVDERGDLIGGCTQRVKSSSVTLAKRRKDSGPFQGVICLEGGCRVVACVAGRCPMFSERLKNRD